MKPREADLIGEISKLQCMVSELKTGFSSALLELSQIQHGNAYLREELEENWRSCQKKAVHLEALVESLRVDLGEMQHQILQLYSNKQRLQEGKSSTSKQKDSNAGDSACEQSHCVCLLAPSSCLSRGKLLLRCFLQGLKAGLSKGTDTRHQVVMQLLHSEWEYVSTLNQVYNKYKTPPAHLMNKEPHQTCVTFVERLLERHLLFKNKLQERLSAQHWNSLVGDILVQLIGQNDTAFSDIYLGYTTTLVSFLILEFNRLNHPDSGHKVQHSNQREMKWEEEEVKLLSLLIAPVSRIHSYLSHIQSLLQWTGKEHPDYNLLLGCKQALRSVLSCCHVILEENMKWEEGQGAGQRSCSEAETAGCSANCCKRDQQSRESQQKSTAQIEDQQAADLTNGCHSMRLECWSCSPVRRIGCGRDWTTQHGQDCGHLYCSLLTPDTAEWGENSNPGRGTCSQHTRKGNNSLEVPHTTHSPENCETDPDNTSTLDYSSIFSSSPDGTLCREEAVIGKDGEEEDSQVPVLLKPSYSQQPRDGSRERTVSLRWQIPRLTPHPPLGNTTGPPCSERPMPCLANFYGKRLVSAKKGSPPLHQKSAFRPIWDNPSKQADSAPEKDNRQGFIPIQAQVRHSFQSLNPSRENVSPGLSQWRRNHPAVMSSTLWDDSEDSEGPCSTV